VTFEVTMPQMGADMTEGTLVRWLKQVGDHVERGDILAEIETDKATVELEAFESGDLLKQLVAEGEDAPVGDVIALLGDRSEALPDVQRKPAAVTPAPRHIEPDAQGQSEAGDGQVATPSQPVATRTPLKEAEMGPAPEESSVPAEVTRETPSTSPANRTEESEAPGKRVRISPVARRIASESGIDVRALQGSGPDGRILRRDVETAIAAAQKQPAPPVAQAPAAPQQRAAAQPARQAQPASGVQPLSKMRQAIARRMTQSKQTEPHYYLTLDIDMTDAMAFRKQLNAAASETQRVSVNDLIVKACAIALQRHPKFHAEYTEAGLQYHDRINIDIGIALEEGLMAPAILDCGTKSLGRIAEEAKDLIERAKGGRLTAEEYSEGNFTITNLGAYGVETLIGIINPPQAAILGVGSVMPQPAVREDRVVVRQLMKVALSADHRVSDGAEGARFIKEIQSLLENPVTLAL
jgi:pyruvate dehydrogenase E2 component (dihydrolipoamide acetyltransferase)